MIKLTKQVPEALDLLILPLAHEDSLEKLSQTYGLNLALNLLKKDFNPKLGAIKLIYSQGQTSIRILLVGLGPRKKLNSALLRQVLNTAVRNVPINLESFGLILDTVKIDAQALEIIGLSLTEGLYRFDSYKKSLQEKQNLKQIYLIAKNYKPNLLKEILKGQGIGVAANNAKDLANHPGNVATPSHLAKHAQEIGKQLNISVKILGPKEIKSEGLGLLWGVSQGSLEEPRFIILEYGPRKQTPIILIGKGLTFDSGGVNIKPSEHLEEMKYDMAGAASVLGIMEAVARLKINKHIVALIPSAENLVSGSSLKPGDILTSHAGITVEIINTDAEGRLVLADAISFAKKYYKPRLIVDYATLTGAVIIALGDSIAGFFSNTNKFTKTFEKASKVTGEKIWPLPMPEEYEDQLKSSIADIKNLGEKAGGAISAAMFLQDFATNTPWIHLDIAGTAWTTKPKPHQPLGATGWGVYSGVEFLRQL